MTNKAIFALLSIFWAAGLAATELSRNPFRALIDPQTDAPGTGQVTAGPPEALRLKGIAMIDGQILVNFGGHILAPGEQAEGFWLVSATEEEAVFLRDGNRIVMKLYPAEDPDQEGE